MAYGGFLLLDASKKVVAVQAVSTGVSDLQLEFLEPRKWREAYTEVLKSAGRRATGADFALSL